MQPEKTEKQKMLAGELYWAADAELVAGRRRAARLTREYNATTEEEMERRSLLLQELFGQVGPKIYIEPPFRCDYGSNIYAGENVYMNFGCIILDCSTVKLGDNLLCAPNVQIYAAHHPVSPAERLTGLELASPVTIGNNVWLGGGVIVCPGVTIGDNTTIGAGSVVTKDIPANVVAVGNPCRVIRELGVGD
jgi:maltose O-acetyltransferase